MRPRKVSGMRRNGAFKALPARLDQVTAYFGGSVYYCDRETGQLCREQIYEDSPAPPYCLLPVRAVPEGAAHQ